MLYKNTKLRCLSFEGNTKADLVIMFWQKLNFMQRFDIMQKVKSFKSSALYERACINFLYENFEYYQQTFKDLD